jgi:hypothetical protein
MTNRVLSQSFTSLGRAYGISPVAVRFSSVAILLLMLSQGTSAFATSGKGSDVAISCRFNDSAFDPSTDVHAIEEYKQVIADLLKQEKFVALDCIADSARLNKTRFSGGTWKLHKIYSGLDEPQPGHATQTDWRNHMERLDRWVEEEPSPRRSRLPSHT